VGEWVGMAEEVGFAPSGPAIPGGARTWSASSRRPRAPSCTRLWCAAGCADGRRRTERRAAGGDGGSVRAVAEVGTLLWREDEGSRPWQDEQAPSSTTPSRPSRAGGGARQERFSHGCR